MIHEVNYWTDGKIADMTDDLVYARKLQKRCFRLLASRSTYTVKQLTEKTEKYNWWLDAREAVKLGFADEII